MTNLQRVRAIRNYTETARNWPTASLANLGKKIALIFATIHNKPQTTQKLKSIIEKVYQEQLRRLK